MFIIGFLFGAVLGSFVLVLADRSISNKSFLGRSYCPSCKHKLRWYDLFPILSYISLRGRCRYCKEKIKIDYLLVEVILGLIIGFLFWQSTINLQFTIFNFQSILNFQFTNFILELFLKIFFITILAALFITDLREMFIPDRIVLPAIAVGLVSLFLITVYKIGYLYYYLSQTAIGRLLLPPHSDYFQRHTLMTAQPFFGSLLMGILIGGFFLLLIIITKGKGMGGGDVKLGAFIGVMLGFPLSLVALILSFITGAIASIFLILAGKKHFGQVIPFGPFLVLGSLIALFWGERILNWYLKLGI